MQISYATEPGPGYVNEDRAVCGDGWAVVLDGATAPADVDSGCAHGVSWLVDHLAAALAGRMLLGGPSLADMLAASIAETSMAHATRCDLNNPDSPSSTVAIARIRDGEMDYLVLGDSPVVVNAPGEVTVIADDRIANLPGGRPYSLELVRYLRNRPGGFWVASTDIQAAYRAVTGSMPLAAGSEVGLFTDGVSRLTEFYGYDWEQVFAVMETAGPAGLISLVRSRESDAPLEVGKKHDDATAVLMADERAEAVTRKPVDWRSLVGL